MKITILCAGKFKEAYWEAAAAEYQKRLTRYCSLQVIVVADEATPEHASEKEEQKIREKEGERMIAWLDKNAQGPGNRVIALAIKGKRMDSIEFASYIEAAQNEGCMQLIFIIGGSLGLSDAVLRRADMRLSFSEFTFPHQLMRVILLEQIYRASRFIGLTGSSAGSLTISKRTCDLEDQMADRSMRFACSEDRRIWSLRPRMKKRDVDIGETGMVS